MVTFRFYVVSTVALFLALAIGVVVGSALDEQIVDSMQDRIDRVEDNLDETVSSIDEKNQEIEDLERYGTASAPYAVDGRLVDTEVLLVAEEGVDAQPVEDLVTRIRQASGEVVGIVWLQPAFGLEDDERAEALATALDLRTDSDRRLQAAAARRLVDDLVALRPPALDGESPTTSTTAAPTTTTAPTTTIGPPTTDGAPSDVFGLPSVVALEEAGFVRLQRIEGQANVDVSQLAFVGVTGATSELADPGDPLFELAATAAASGLASVVADVHEAGDDDPERGTVLADIPGDATVSTVDDLERLAGRRRRSSSLSTPGRRASWDGTAMAPRPTGSCRNGAGRSAGFGSRRRGRPFRRGHGCRGSRLPGVRGGPRPRDRRRPRDDVPRQHVPGLQHVLDGALRAAGGRRPLRGPRPHVPAGDGGTPGRGRRGARGRRAGGGHRRPRRHVGGGHRGRAPRRRPAGRRRRRPGHRRGPARAVHVPAPVLHPPDRAVRDRRDRHGGAARCARRFVLPAVAPIGNTVVVVAFLVAFALVAGPGPGLDLPLGQKLLLALGGTLGVAAFVAVPTVGVLRSGFRFRPRFGRPDRELRRLLALSGWASVQHAGAAVLLGVAIVVGGGVEGGVVAYQVGWFFFLAPYGIIAQPIHTAILPELVDEHGAGDVTAFGASLRWALDSMTVLILPLTALVAALAVPTMTVLAFGEAGSDAGVDLLAAALASLAFGFLPYGAFLLLARAWYVLGDSRTPALASLGAAVVGGVLMVVVGLTTSEAATVFGLGLAYAAAFACSSTGLALGLWRRTRQSTFPPLLPKALLVSLAVGLACWSGYEAWAPVGKPGALVSLAVLGGAGTLVYVGLVRLLGVSVTRRLPRRRGRLVTARRARGGAGARRRARRRLVGPAWLAGEAGDVAAAATGDDVPTVDRGPRVLGADPRLAGPRGR
ncbi:MAG: copper transporter [Acidimicrobiia bacterium]|nr:copper transporter [Acidimicrobiia bacterium]